MSHEEQDLIRAVAGFAVEQAAPEELPLFEETAGEYFRNPAAVFRSRQRDDAVGFGLELTLLTPYVLAVAGHVVQLLYSIVQETFADELKSTVAQRVRRLVRRDGGGGDSLTPEQLGRVRATAYARAVQLGLDDGRAGLLADSVAGGLVTVRA